MMPLENQNRAGIVTVNAWTMAADGNNYLYFWSDDWRIFTDKDMPIDGFRSTEHWQLLAFIGCECVALFPGCQVKAWIASTAPPQTNTIFDLTKLLSHEEAAA